MEQILFERPREKLQAKGAAALTLIELIQLIIGSGSSRVSGAALARKVEKLIASEKLEYAQLVEISGLGVAKVCQLLAAVEVGKRLSDERGVRGRGLSRLAIDAIVADVRASRRLTLVCYWFDGSLRQIDKKSYILHAHEHYSLVCKRLFGDVLAASAHAIFIGLKTASDPPTPSTQELGLIRSIKSSAEILTIRLLDVYAVTATTETSWKEEV